MNTVALKCPAERQRDRILRNIRLLDQPYTITGSLLTCILTRRWGGPDAVLEDLILGGLLNEPGFVHLNGQCARQTDEIHCSALFSHDKCYDMDLHLIALHCRGHAHALA